MSHRNIVYAMKKITETVSSLLSRILAGALVIFGYGCSSDEDETLENMQCMYGGPTGTFELKGSVTAANAESTTPVAAKVIVTAPNYPSTLPFCYATEKTSDNGQFDINGETTSNELKVVCVPNDPGLESDSVVVKVKFEEVTPKRDFWIDMGHTNVNVDFKLKEKEKTAEE